MSQNDQQGANIEIDGMNILDIMAYLPHRYPFLMVDRVTKVVANETLHAIKNVTVNEPYFLGHFPKKPVMPGVMILEAMAQATGILGFITEGIPPNDKSHLYYFVGVDKARFRQVVVPGDQLIIEVDLIKIKRGIYCFEGVAKVDGSIACSAELMCTKRPMDVML